MQYESFQRSNDEKPSWWNRFTQKVKDGSKTMSRKTMNLGRTLRSETRKVGNYMNREDTSEEKNNRNIFDNLANKIYLVDSDCFFEFDLKRISLFVICNHRKWKWKVI